MTQRAGFIALIGEPNAGKSTLTNAMVGAKVSIVTHKVQTTRARIRGVALEGDSQIVFVDTPGLFRPRRRLDRAMVAAAWGGAADADIIVIVINSIHQIMILQLVAKVELHAWFELPVPGCKQHVPTHAEWHQLP